jgi:hydroxymethylpyrimidine pyrophosphatase-like HAD family hydrolase
MTSEQQPDSPSLIVTDLDGTLFQSRGVVTHRTISVLRRCLDSGLSVAIATARPYLSVFHLLDQRLHSGLFWVCSNGAAVYRDHRLISETPLTPEEAQSVLSRLYSSPNEYVVSLEAAGKLYIDKFVRHDPVPYEVADLLEIAKGPVTKILVSLAGGQPGLVSLPDLPTGVAVMTAGGGAYTSILSPEATKESGIEAVLSELQIDWPNVMAFGDDLNDLGMLAASGIGVAMGNSVPEALQAANRVTLSNTEDGVAIVLEALLQG